MLGPRRIITPVAILIAGCASTAPTELDLLPRAFGPEQQRLYAVRSGINFALDPAVTMEAIEHPELGMIEVRDEQIAVLRGRRAGEYLFAVDTDRNSSFANEQYAPADGASRLREIQFGDERVPVELTVGPDKGEYIVRELWQLTITSGNESLDLGVLRFGQQGVGFADADDDGIFETFMAPGNPIALGGRFWQLDLEFESRTAHLVRSKRAPIDAGYEAPKAEGTRLETQDRVDLTTDDVTTVLVFCNAGCRGCRLIAESLEAVSDRFADSDVVRLISVGRSAEESRGCRESVCPSFLHVVSPNAWEAFAVTPTPTIIVVGPDRMIRYRGPGAGKRTADLLFDVID